MGASASTERCRDGYTLTTDEWYCQKTTASGGPSHDKNDNEPQRYLRECKTSFKSPENGYWELKTTSSKCRWKACIKANL